jgi:flavorubredoxin
MANKKSLWITRRLSKKTLERAQKYYDCVINFDDQPISQKELSARSSEFDAILPCHSEIFKGELVQ